MPTTPSDRANPPRRLYFDNAATSFPKPRAVVDAMVDYQTNIGASPGRGGYAETRLAAERMNACRTLIARLINAPSADHIIFTLNTSDALNLAIKGIVRTARPDRPIHIVTTAMDHNSVLRPLRALQAEPALSGRLRVTYVPVDPATTLIDPQALRDALTPDTRLVAVVHASNVTGAIQPVAEIGRICREHAVPLLVDAAQSVGHIPVDVQALSIDLLAAPGHKGLLGPLGTGFLYMRPGLETLIAPLREGGTGSISEQDVQPTTMPDRYECGSHNAVGLIGLAEGIRYLLERGMDHIWAHERALTEQFLQGLHTHRGGPLLPGLCLLGPSGVKDRLGVFSVNVEGVTPAQLARELEERFGILTRAGLHCAPYAHQTLRTDPASVGSPEEAGAVRFSVGPFLSVQDVRYATDALATICEERHGAATAAHR